MCFIWYIEKESLIALKDYDTVVASIFFPIDGPKTSWVKISFGQPLHPPASAMGVNEPAWKEEEDRETQSFKDKKTQMEQEVYRMRT